MSQENQERFDQFLNGTLSEEAKKDFEESLANDPAFLKAFETHRRQVRGVQELAFRELVDQVNAERIKNKAGRGIIIPNVLRFAAAILLLLGTAWWFLPNKKADLTQELVYKLDPGLPTTLGLGTDKQFAEAMIKYKQGDYPVAKADWEQMLANQPENDTLIYYLGQIELAQERPQIAILRFNEVLQKDQSIFQTAARYYLAISYYEQGDQSLGIKLLKALAEKESNYQSRAVDLLEVITSD